MKHSAITATTSLQNRSKKVIGRLIDWEYVFVKMHFPSACRRKKKSRLLALLVVVPKSERPPPKEMVRVNWNSDNIDLDIGKVMYFIYCKAPL